MDGMILRMKLLGYGQYNIDEALSKLHRLIQGQYVYITPIEKKIIEVIAKEVKNA